jgi:peptide/nickel transport system permease protein
MLRVALVRVGVGLLTLWAVSLVVFLGTEALPGDAATAALGREATPEAVAELRAQFQLDRPVLTRYWEWLSGFVQGDLGRSLPSGERVSSLVADPVANTAVLAAVTIAILIPLALFLGIVSAVRRDRLLDHSVAWTTLAMISLPEFVTGSLLAILFAVWLPWLPAVSLVDPSQSLLSQRSILVLPVATLIVASVAQMTRLVRASLIDVLQSEYVETARLKGVPERRVLVFHALPNALGPTIQVAAITVAWLAGGVVVTESVFQYNGIGLAFTGAVASRDLPTVQAIAMIIAAVYVLVNLAADLAVIFLNPRLRRPR